MHHHAEFGRKDSGTAASLNTPQRSTNGHSLEEGYVHNDVFLQKSIGFRRLVTLRNGKDGVN